MYTKKEAETRGNALLNRMHGIGWKLRVWENMGWHFAVGNGSIDLSEGYTRPGKKPTYHILMGTVEGGVGGTYPFVMEGRAFTDPNKAVRVQMKYARQQIDALTALVTKMERNIFPKASSTPRRKK